MYIAMNSRAFLLSLVVALMAVYMAYSYIQGEKSKLVKNHGQLVPVVVAKKDINSYEVIDDTKVTIVSIPQSYVQKGAFKSAEEVYNTIAATAILQGEQISSPRVTYPGAISGLAYQVTPGKRAMAIRVSEDQAVSRLIKPGDRIDVLALIDYTGGRKDALKVRTIFQDVLVLSTGLYISNSLPLIGLKVDEEVKKLNLNTYGNFNTITLELDPLQVQKVIFLNALGSQMYLSLRNNEDRSIDVIKPSKIYDVLEEDKEELKIFFEKIKEKDKNRASIGS
jgi:pilus assembly protein CpaB